MPRVPAGPPADRFFAYVQHFECECPNCGRVIGSRDGRRHLGREARRWLEKATWNPVTQRLRCRHCQKVFMVGLILHPVGAAPGRLLPPPPDVLPTAREVAAIRARAQGVHPYQPLRSGQHANLVVTAPCTCPDRGEDPTCPVHRPPSAE